MPIIQIDSSGCKIYLVAYLLRFGFLFKYEMKTAILAAMAKTLYIIDGHAHIYSAFYAPIRQNLTSPSGEPTKATYIFTNMLLKLIENKKPDMLVVAMDSKTPSFRADLYPEYKAHRPPMPEEMPVQINRIEQILEAMRIPMIRRDGFEADDIIGTLCKKASDVGIDAYICSKDKDMLQLLGEKVFIYDVKTNEITDTDKFKLKTGLSPNQFIDVLALQGDTADNVPGVPDVGPKTAMDWIKKYDSLDNLYANSTEIGGKRGDNLREYKDKAYLSQKLVTIKCDMPIDFDEKAFAASGSDSDKLSSIFAELGFSKFTSQAATAAQNSPAAIPAEGMKTAKTVKHDYRLIDTSEKLDELVEKLKKQKLIAFDTETTSISAHRAELVGMSFCWESHNACYVAVKAPMGTKCISMAELREKIAPVMADTEIKKIGQNIKYDIIVMHNAGIDVGGVFFDTMIASYVLDAERRSHSMDNMAIDFLNYQTIPIAELIGKGKKQLTFDLVDTETACEYAAEDADITFQLYQVLNDRLENQQALKRLFTEIEMPLVEVLTKMELAGVSIDVSTLKQMALEINKSLEKITAKIYELSVIEFNIDSPKQLSGILFDTLGLQSVRSGKTGRSTDAAVLEELRGSHPIIKPILEYRQLSKLKNTYVDKLGALINRRTNRLHASFNQTITATGRLSSSNPNLQNIPIRTEIGRKIRSAFVPAQKTDRILSLDYSQIELRILAHLCGDETLKQAFEQNRDIHSFVASQIYSVNIEDVTSEMRSRCKAVNFGIIYGQGPFGLSKTTGLSMAEAKKFIEDYFARYKSIKQFKEDAIKTAQKTGYAETICNRRRNISGLDSKNFNVRSQADRLVINTLIQGSAADLIKIAMINIQNRIERENLTTKMILQIHDELVFELPAEKGEQYTEIFASEMTGAMQLDVPLKVDASIGPSWFSDK
ncbi:MAG: DNA polymerase I [Anaerohalosphaeraceae bacterium]|nr:DNA polymerase I [Anaerohalosphaeraceae bacterium]